MEMIQLLEQNLRCGHGATPHPWGPLGQWQTSREDIEAIPLLMRVYHDSQLAYSFRARPLRNLNCSGGPNYSVVFCGGGPFGWSWGFTQRLVNLAQAGAVNGRKPKTVHSES